MVDALIRKTKKLAIAASFCGLFAFGAWGQQQDPPSRVARLSYVNGNVSMEPAGVDDWAPAERNRPFSTGDYLYTDQGAQAELHLDVAALRMSPQTSFGFLNLDNQTVQIKLSEGEMYFRVRNFGSNQVFEVDTPNAALTFLQNGIYVVSVDPNANTSYLTVREGQAQVTGGGQAFTVDQGSSVNLSGTDQLGYDVEQAQGPDQFESWSAQRDQHESNLRSSRYVPPTVIGYEDLDDYGGWQSSPQYGNVWYPNDVNPGWAPYQSGHWAWQDPWGYTWVDDAPWGFAPFHYGRWAYIGNRWGWCPGPIGIGYGGPVVQPYYAPALVAFFGGSNFGVSIGIGGGPSLGWVPLGYGEVYTPPYAVSPGYFRQVNVTNTRITNVTNITNVYNNVYVNRTPYNQAYVNTRAPNAVMAMPQSAFASGRNVRQVARPVPAADVSRIRSAAILAPRVAPTRQAVIPATSRLAPRPAAQVLQRQVVARNTPPPAPAPFAAKQAYLQQHAASGQPYNHAAMRQAVAPRAAPAAAVAKAPAPATRPVAVRPGERGGNVAALPAARPGARPGQPTSAERPGQPATTTNRTPQPPPTRQGAETREPAPAAATHGTPPNRRPANTAEPNRPDNNPANASRPGQPAPATRGTPPNMREGNPSQPAARTPERTPAPAARPETRSAPAARPETRPTPEARPVEPARPEARPAPTPSSRPEAKPRQQPEARPEPEARSTPTTVRPQARPEPQARAESRSAPEPRPDIRPTPEPRAPQARPEPAARSETRPAPEHGTPPPTREQRSATDRSTRDTKEPR
jgi:hypothetical protein